MNAFMVFIADNSLVIGLVLIAFAIACAFVLTIRFGKEFFLIYKNSFVATVDRGFQDVLIYLDPGQVFTVTVALTVVVVPVIYWFLGFWMAVAALFLVATGPSFIFRGMKDKRSDMFIKLLPDTLISLSASLKAGLNLVKSLNQIVKNQPDPISSEFAQVLVEYRVGQDLNESLSELAGRIDREELVLMNAGIKISREVGGNLSDTLDVLAKTLRAKAEAQGKVKALTAMGRAQAMVAIGLPILVGGMFAVVEPLAMMKLFTTQLGIIWLGIMIFMMILALVFIRKIVSFDV